MANELDQEQQKKIAEAQRIVDPKANLSAAEILGLTPGATYSPDALRQAYKKRSINFHPDKNLDQTGLFNKAFQSISAAYQALGAGARAVTVPAASDSAPNSMPPRPEFDTARRAAQEVQDEAEELLKKKKAKTAAELQKAESDVDALSAKASSAQSTAASTAKSAVGTIAFVACAAAGPAGLAVFALGVLAAKGVSYLWNKANKPAPQSSPASTPTPTASTPAIQANTRPAWLALQDAQRPKPTLGGAERKPLDQIPSQTYAQPGTYKNETYPNVMLTVPAPGSNQRPEIVLPPRVADMSMDQRQEQVNEAVKMAKDAGWTAMDIPSTTFNPVDQEFLQQACEANGILFTVDGHPYESALEGPDAGTSINTTPALD